MNIIELIEKKRDGKELTQFEYNYFIEAYCKDEIADYQVSALLMAIYIRGMTREELFFLTSAMIASGEVLDFSHAEGIYVDKHSTGGVGDKVSLVLTPILAACGLKVAKMSGRGLSFTGGTLDKLEAIPGFDVNLGEVACKQQVADIGLSIIAQTKSLVYADKKLYALRDVTGTVSSIPLIASSIMSKKIAAGSSIILLDVKCGNGAFMETVEDAKMLAQAMIDIAKQMHRKVIVEITSMDDVLGYSVGNALEVMEAIDTLKGKGEPRFIQLCKDSAIRLLVAAGMYEDKSEASKAVDQVLQDQSALAKLKAMIVAQHGDVSVVDDYRILQIAPDVYHLDAQTNGYLTHVAVKDIGLLACELGAGRKQKQDVIDPGVGIVVHKKLGDYVHVGECLCSVYYRPQKPIDTEHLQTCFTLSKQPRSKVMMVYDVME